MDQQYSNEMRDFYNQQILSEYQKAEGDFKAALEQLNLMSTDFSEGSQQRWMITMRECSALRDFLWYLQQRADNAGA